MKNKILTTTTVLAALVGAAQISRADGALCKFTPMEELPPEVRQELNSKISDLTKDIDIDWDQLVVGVDENDKLCVRTKSEIELQKAGTFSCAVSMAPENDIK